MNQFSKIKVKDVFPCRIGGDTGQCIYPLSKFGCCGQDDEGKLVGCDRAKAHLLRCANDRGDSASYALYVYPDDPTALSLLREDGEGFIVQKGQKSEIR